MKKHKIKTEIGVLLVSPDMIVNPDFIDDDSFLMVKNESYNPHSCSFFVVGNEFGALAIVFCAEHEVLDEAVNGDKLDCMLLDAGTLKEYLDNNYDVSYLGNASEPFNLSYAWVTPYPVDTWLVETCAALNEEQT